VRGEVLDRLGELGDRLQRAVVAAPGPNTAPTRR
jgi:hypothetical protein